jgi:hypothetical protein
MIVTAEVGKAIITPFAINRVIDNRFRHYVYCMAHCH